MKDTLKLTASLKIFDDAKVKAKVDKLFMILKPEIIWRFYEIKDSLTPKLKNQLSEQCLFRLFKVNFFKQILAEALEITVHHKKADYDIIENVMLLLTEENLRKAILGEPMINAFSSAIRMSSDDFSNTFQIMLIEKNFLECKKEKEQAFVP